MVATIPVATPVQVTPPAPKPKVGLVGFLCDVTTEPVDFVDCLGCAFSGAPGCSFHPALISEIVEKVRDPEYANTLAQQNGAEVGFSVTEIVGCPRQLILKKHYPHYETIGAMYRMFFGTGVHQSLSNYTSLNGYKEFSLTWKFQFSGKHILLVGTPDLFEYNALSDGWRITDYKVTANPPFGRKVPICVQCRTELHKNDQERFVCPTCGEDYSPRSQYVSRIWKEAQPRSSHVMQVNLYALLIEKNAARLSDIHPVKSAEIMYLGPKAPIRCEAPLDREKTMAFLKARLSTLLAGSLPPILDEVDELWHCDYCPVHSFCEQEHGGPVGKAAIEER